MKYSRGISQSRNDSNMCSTLLV